MAKIAFVEPEPPGYHVYSGFDMPRMGLPSLGAVLRQSGHDVTIYCQSIRPARVEDLLAADIVGISTTTSTAPEAYRLADLCRQAGKPVILGGVHVTFCTDEALEHADYAVRGEAEQVITPLVERIAAGAPVDDLPGVFTEPGQAPVEVPVQCRIQDLNALPFPDLSLVKGWRSQGPVTPMLTSRGCPHDCKFCSVAPMFGRHYRFRDTDSVLDELALLKPRGTLFFYDDNFAASRRRTIELLEGMLSRGLKTHWAAQVRADVTRDLELMRLFRRSGCHRVYVGYESISAATLEEYDKGKSVEEIVASVRIFHEHGIKTHGMFVLGSDSDDLQTIRETSRFARRHHINSVQFMVLTPLPGTRTFDELSAAGRIFEHDWRRYDGQHVVFDPSKMTAAELQREAWRAQERFYSLRECFKSFASLHLEDGAVKTYAWNLMRRCKKGIGEFVEQLRHREMKANPELGVAIPGRRDVVCRHQEQSAAGLHGVGRWRSAFHTHKPHTLTVRETTTMDKKTLIEGIAVGAVAGAIAGLMLAPKSGQEMRDDMKADLMEMKDKIVERLQAMETFTQDKYNEVVKAVIDEYTAAKKITVDQAKELEATLRDGHDAIRQTIHEHTAPTEPTAAV